MQVAKYSLRKRVLIGTNSYTCSVSVCIYVHAAPAILQALNREMSWVARAFALPGRFKNLNVSTERVCAVIVPRFDRTRKFRVWRDISIIAIVKFVGIRIAGRFWFSRSDVLANLYGRVKSARSQIKCTVFFE